MTVMQAIAAGGGITPRGSDRRLKLRRAGADGKLVETDASLRDPVKARRRHLRQRSPVLGRIKPMDLNQFLLALRARRKAFMHRARSRRSSPRSRWR